MVLGLVREDLNGNREFYEGFNEKWVISSYRLDSQREIHVQELH